MALIFHDLSLLVFLLPISREFAKERPDQGGKVEFSFIDRWGRIHFRTWGDSIVGVILCLRFLLKCTCARQGTMMMIALGDSSAFILNPVNGSWVEHWDSSWMCGWVRENSQDPNDMQIKRNFHAQFERGIFFAEKFHSVPFRGGRFLIPFLRKKCVNISRAINGH